MQSSQLARGAFGLQRPQLRNRSAKPLAQEISERRAAAFLRQTVIATGISRKICANSENSQKGAVLTASTSSALGLWLLSTLPALADETVDFSKGGFAKESYYVTLGLFLLSLPGLWSQIKRAPKAKKVRKTFEVAGPSQPDAMPLDQRARQVFQYFKKYNYEIAQTGDVIKFEGTYQASRGQAAALIFYVFCGLASTALVLSIAAPFGGQNWYYLTLLSPLSGLYYWQRGTRKEEVQVKMVTADDDSVTDILCEGPEEEMMRFSKELGLNEKGKELVKGILER
ncbi:Protein COFACTOR ASSEMBLY OF COMPLEX C SUBUNIT B CCB1, chloroplastic [Coccomyxa sp. Obi]|nr:Protein COFACTOR ASSEMBLY OF COMPLEX C SUBUNIT B CCB1, chloroplastic [Coccomyxa sp. Obi]